MRGLVCQGQSIPSSAQAIVGNATVVNNAGAPSGINFITLYPSNASQPLVSNLNFTTPGQITPNAFTVGVGNDGAFKIFTSEITNFLVDLSGYFAP